MLVVCYANGAKIKKNSRVDFATREHVFCSWDDYFFTNSTRRFLARPSSVELSATGS